MYIHGFVVKTNNTVGSNECIAVANFVVFIYQRIFIFFILFAYKFLGSEKITPIVVVCFFHCFVDLNVSQRFISCVIQFVNLSFQFFIYVYIYNHKTRLIGVIALININQNI